MRSVPIEKRREAASKPLLLTSDIERLMNCSRTTASKVYQQARDIDDREIGRNRGTYFVRNSSVLKAVGITTAELQAMLDIAGGKQS